MDLARSVYSRDLKIAAMRALDSGSAASEIARKYQLSPKLLERWRGVWRAKGELAFPGTGRRGSVYRRWTTPTASPNWSARLASSRWRMSFLKKACSISGIIILRPASMARMRV